MSQNMDRTGVAGTLGNFAAPARRSSQSQDAFGDGQFLPFDGKISTTLLRLLLIASIALLLHAFDVMALEGSSVYFWSFKWLVAIVGPVSAIWRHFNPDSLQTDRQA